MQIEEVNFSISLADLCTEKTGKIYRDYTILNPPIGKGFFILFKKKKIFLFFLI